jgi:Fur family transcriptional regulator, ferric uptake regulator
VDRTLRDRWLAHATATLGRSGLRAGAARTAVVEHLADQAQCLVGAQDVVDGLRDRGTRTSQASVYRVLDELQGLGLLRRIVGEDGVARYEIAAPGGQHHHHFVDADSGEIEPFADAELERAIAEAAARMGVVMTHHEVVVTGRRATDDESPPATRTN